MSDNSEKPDKSPKSNLWDLCDDISSSSLSDSDVSRSNSGNNSTSTTPRKNSHKSSLYEPPIKGFSLSLRKPAETSMKMKELFETNNSTSSSGKTEIDIPDKDVSTPNPKDNWAEIDSELEQLAKDTSLDDITSSDSGEDVETKLSTAKQNKKSGKKTCSQFNVSMKFEPKDIPDVSSQEDFLTKENIDVKFTDKISVDDSEHANGKEALILESFDHKVKNIEEVHSKKVVIEQTIHSDEKDIVTDSVNNSENLSEHCVVSEALPSENLDIDSDKSSKKSINFDKDSSKQSSPGKDPVVSSYKPVTSDKENMLGDDLSKEPAIIDMHAVSSESENINKDICEAILILDKQNMDLDNLSKNTVNIEEQCVQSDSLVKEPVTSYKQNKELKKSQDPMLTVNKVNIELDKLPIEPEILDKQNIHTDEMTDDSIILEKTYIESALSTKETISMEKQDIQSEKLPEECVTLEKQNIELDESLEDEQNTQIDELSLKSPIEETVTLDKENIQTDKLPFEESLTMDKKNILSFDLSNASFNYNLDPSKEVNNTSEGELSKKSVKHNDSYKMSDVTVSPKKNIDLHSDDLSRETLVKEPSTSDTEVIESVCVEELVTENISNTTNDNVIEEKTSTFINKINTGIKKDDANLDDNDGITQDKSDEMKQQAEETISIKEDNSKGLFDLVTEHSEENSGDGEVPDNTDTLGLFSVTTKPLDRDEEEESNDEIAEDSAEDNQTEKNYASEAPDFSDIDHSLESFATSMMDHEETSSSNNDAAGNTIGLLISSVSGHSEEDEESNNAINSILENGIMKKAVDGDDENLTKVKNADQTSEQVDTEDKESSNGSELVMDLDNEVAESNDNYEDMDIEENLVSTTAIFTAEEQEAVDADSNQTKDIAEESDKLPSNVQIDESSDVDVRPEETEKAEKEEQVMEIVDLDSNSDDDSSKEPPKKKEKLTESNSEACIVEPSTTTTINLPSSIEVMSTSETAKTSTIICNKGESLIKGIPKPPTPKKASGLRINTSEITITTIKTPQQEQSDEVVVLDSDEEEEKSGSSSLESFLKNLLTKRPSTEVAVDVPDYSEIQEISKDKNMKSRTERCVNSDCTSTADTTEYYRCPLYVLSHYGLKRKGGTQKVCEHCLESVIGRMQELMNCAREGNPLWEMHLQAKEDLVEISDSDEDDDTQAHDTEPLDKLGYHNAELFEKHLEQTLNETWFKFKFVDQIKQSELQFLDRLLEAEKLCKEVDTLFNDTQKMTDAMRAELYGEFPVDRHELSPLDITDEAELKLRASLESNTIEFSPVTSTLHHKGLTPKKLSDDDDWTPAALGEELSDLSIDLDAQGRRSSRQRKTVNYRDMEGAADKESVTEEDLSKLALNSFIKNALEVQSQIKSAEVRPNVIALPPPEPHTEETQAAVGQPTQRDVTTNNEPSVISDSENCTSDNADDVSDVSLVGDIVVERAPADLPPNGELFRKPLQPGDGVYARKSATFGGWGPATVMHVWPRGTKQNNGVPSPFTLCRVKFYVPRKNVEMVKQLNARNLAYGQPASVRYPIGARVVALFAHKDNDQKGSYYSGIIAETPTPVNDYRYIVFFDDGYVQYVQHKDIRLVVEHSQRVYEDVLLESRDFVKDYLSTYPERPMVRLQKGQALKVQDSSKKWSSARVMKVDASLAQVMFEEDNHVEWIYRGSTRLAPLYLELKAAGKPQRRRGLGLSKTATMFNTPYVEYTRVDSIKDKTLGTTPEDAPKAISELRIKPRRGRAVAKKSLAAPPAIAAVSDSSSPGDSRSEAEASRVVYYSPKIPPKSQTMSLHECSEACRRTDVLTMHELRTYNPLARPLLTGFQRNHIVVGGKRAIEYRAPCGRRVRNVAEMHRYLRTVGSDMSVDLFHFDPAVHCLAEFVLNWCRVSKKDLSHGMENVPIPCVNFYDSQLPPFCAYSTARIPTVGVHLNLDPDFLCGCDCTDDCADKSKCACWQLTLSGARAIGKNSTNVGYHYKRLPEALPTGIFECNSKCKCRVATCLNRVVQHPLQLKLQVFKTVSRGWGIRALNDVPKGTFLCIYSGNLLTDSTANVDGLLEGDEYLAELDYIEVVERMKEAFEPDVPLRDRILDSKGLVNEDDEDEDFSEDESQSEHDKDFQPDVVDMRIASNDIGSRLRKRTKKAQYKPAKSKSKEKEKKKASPIPEVKVAMTPNTLSDKQLPDPDEEFTITISDDDEAREPSSFAATGGCDDEEYVPRNMSVRELFGRDEKCYIMDAKVRGNIGRYLNHSCAPNVFVQNVFVDTHDPRFPWVGFFAQSFIRAGVELTWNYNYDIGSVPDKIIYCKCGTDNCRGRLL